MPHPVQRLHIIQIMYLYTAQLKDGGVDGKR